MKIDMKELAKLPRSQQVRLVSQAMRDMDPEGYDKAATSVRRNMAAAVCYQPQLFAAKH